jgi:DNA-directed RNA polymerase specialized sigma24 family protein
MALFEKRDTTSMSQLSGRDLTVDFSNGLLIQAWKKLPDEDRLTLYLIDVEHLSLEKVGVMMEIPAVSVGHRADRAREELRRSLTSHLSRRQAWGCSRDKLSNRASSTCLTR